MAEQYAEIFNVADFVNATVPVIEQSLSVTVTDSAREELIERMRPHEQQVESDLSTGKMTFGELELVLRSVLEDARSLSDGRQPLDRDLVSKAMSRRCRYLGWC